jgi:hypothetical protein
MGWHFIPDKHHLRVGRSNAENKLDAGIPQRAAGAVFVFFVEGLKRGGF